MKKEKKNQRRILVIDDNQHLIATIGEYLQSHGFEVVTALDGVDIFNLIESETYDLVLTDIDMPIVSGIGVILAHKKKKPEIPIIAMSGYGQAPLDAAREKGADVIINKPFRFSDLTRHIDKLITHH